jgi:hypothetical protein
MTVRIRSQFELFSASRNPSEIDPELPIGGVRYGVPQYPYLPHPIDAISIVQRVKCTTAKSLRPHP